MGWIAISTLTEPAFRHNVFSRLDRAGHGHPWAGWNAREGPGLRPGKVSGPGPPKTAEDHGRTHRATGVARTLGRLRGPGDAPHRPSGRSGGLSSLTSLKGRP